MSDKRWLLAALATVSLISAGCGSDQPSEADRASGTSSKETGGRDKTVKFAACMRQNGIDEFPDPDASGDLTIDAIANGSSMDVSSPAWEQAISACKDLQPSGFTGERRSTGQQEAVLRFAACVRRNGVTDFPDPTEDAPIVDTNQIPSTATAGGMSTLNAAMQTCREDLAGVVKAP